MLPADPERLQILPGVGQSTAGAVAAFAFNRPAVFIETNIRRVYIHFFFAGGGAVRDREIRPLVARTLDKGAIAQEITARFSPKRQLADTEEIDRC